MLPRSLPRGPDPRGNPDGPGRSRTSADADSPCDEASLAIRGGSFRKPAVRIRADQGGKRSKGPSRLLHGGRGAARRIRSCRRPPWALDAGASASCVCASSRGKSRFRFNGSCRGRRSRPARRPADSTATESSAARTDGFPPCGDRGPDRVDGERASSPGRHHQWSVVQAPAKSRAAPFVHRRRSQPSVPISAFEPAGLDPRHSGARCPGEDGVPGARTRTRVCGRRQNTGDRNRSQDGGDCDRRRGADATTETPSSEQRGRLASRRAPKSRRRDCFGASRRSRCRGGLARRPFCTIAGSFATRWPREESNLRTRIRSPLL
jgi:hypothetical protein